MLQIGNLNRFIVYRHVYLFLSLLVFLTVTESTLAAEWRSSVGLKAGETYSDNAGLSQRNKNDDFVTVVTPNIKIDGRGARANLNVRSALEFNSQDDNNGDNFNPQLRAHGDVELIEDFFFIDADATARQTAIDPFVATDETSINTRDNSTTTYQYGVSPYISSHLKDYASYQLRYSYDEQMNRGGALDDSNRESALFNLNSGEYFGRLSWGLVGSYSATDYNDAVGAISPTDNSDNEFISASLRLGYQLDRKWHVTGTVGEEWNDFISANNDIDGSFWSAGIVWTPNTRTEVNLNYGERFFGSNPSATIKYHHKKSTFNLGYTRSVTDTRSIRTLGDVLNERNSFGEAIDPFTAYLLSLFSNFTFIENDTIIDERLNASYNLKGKRTTLTLAGDRSDQTSENSNIKNTFSRYSISASRTLVSNLTCNLGYTWDKRENGLTGDTATSDIYRLGFTRQLGPNTNLSLNYSYITRNSDRANDDFDQNRISLFLSITF